MSRKHAVKALSLLGVSSLLGAGLAFILQVILARSLGVDKYGVFSSAFAVVTLLTPLAGFGIAPLWLKVFGLEGRQGGRWVNPSLIFSAITTIVTLLLIASWAFVVEHDFITQLLLLVLSTYVLGQVLFELVSGKLQLEEEYFSLSMWQLMPHLSRFCLVGVVVYFSKDEIMLEYVAYCYAAVSIALMFVGLIHLKSMSSLGVRLKMHEGYYRSIFENSSVRVRDVMRASWPFGIGAFAHLVYYQSDIVMVKYFIGDKAAGEYNVAFVIMSAIYLLPSILYQKFLMPKIHRWSNYDREKFYALYKFGGRAMFFSGCIAMFCIWLLGGWAISFIFGSSYQESANLLKILAFSAPIIFSALNSGAVLVTQDHMIQKVKYMIFVAIVNFILNIIFIPLWAAEGAAFTTVLSNLVLLALYQYGASQKVFGSEKGLEK